MAAPNIDPIFTKTPDVSTNNSTGMGQLVTAAAADYTGISGNYALVWTAGANGGRLDTIRCTAGGTNVAAVVRIFINNGSAVGTATNNLFFGEFNLPVTTASTTAQMPFVEIPINVAIPAGFKVYAGLGAAVAAGWVFAPIAGQY